MFCGSGGVGKTSVAAAAALGAATRLGGKVLVLTIDPARRLATALGLDGIGNVAHRVPDRGAEGGAASSRAASCGPRCSTRSSRGTTSCCGTRPTRRPRTASSRTGCTTTSPRASCRATTTSRWSGCSRSTRRGEYDLIVIDTPPDAERGRLPRRAGAHGRLLRRPAAALAHAAVPRRRQARRARDQRREPALLPDRRPRSSAASSSQDIAEFFLNFQSMYDGFVERAAGGRAAAARPAHDVRGRHHARGRAACTRPSTSARRSRPRLPPRRARAQQDAARPPARSRRRRGRGARSSTQPGPLADALAERRRSRARRSGAHRARAAHGRRVVPRTSRWSRCARPSCAPSSPRVPDVVVARPELRATTSATSTGSPRSASAARSTRTDAAPACRRTVAVSTLDDLARCARGWAGADLVHLERLVAAWRPLADLSFADLAAARADRGRGGPPLRRARAGAAGHRPDATTRRTSSAPSSTRSSGRCSPGRWRDGRDRRGRHAPRSAPRSACACSASRCAAAAG